MIHALHDDDCTVRRAAARALGRIGPAAREALPHLCCASGDPDESVRRTVLEAMARIDPRSPKGTPAEP
jgi:HEAT repeat protein